MEALKQEGIVLHGTGISTGKSAGPLRFFGRKAPANVKKAAVIDSTTEWERIRLALVRVEKDLHTLEKRTREALGESEAQIFEIHRMLIEDEDLVESIRAEIQGGKSAEDAFEAAVTQYVKMFEALGDAYLSARAADMKDISAQLMRALSGDGGEQADDGEPFILVADDLSPSETVMLEKSMILGFVTFRGTPNSHTAILARAMGIPALIGIGTVDEKHDGAYALLDAADGTLTISPTEEQRISFEKKREKNDRIAKEHDRYLRSLMNKPAVTRSGHRILVYANIGDENEVEGVLSNGADGVGLLRSEFLYLGSADYPSEEKLFQAYREIAIRMQGKRTVIRTLDIGADKKIPYFGLPEEENPALGFRAIRICLARPDLFKTQLRAILRASAFGNLSLMLPMIVSIDEIRQSKRLLEDCMRELQESKIEFDQKLELGIMIETPAAAIMSEELASEVDFFSVGTNDLTQYTLAADRQSPSLSHICEENREPILRLIEQAANAIHRTGGWIGICGEMAADLHLTQRFADMRIDELSVSVPYLLGLRGKISECK